MRRIRNFARLWLPAAGLVISAAANAAVVELEFTTSFGTTPATGDAPWLTATFDDGDSAGTVRLTVTALASLGEADVTELYFNAAPGVALGPGDLVFDRVDPGDGSVVGLFDVQTGANAFRAGGDGLYDIWLNLPTADNEMQRLSAGETLVYDITGTGITAADFYLLGAPGPGEGNPGPFLAAAHLQSTGSDQLGSDWVAAVPLPAAFWLFSSSLGMLGFALRRRRSS